jgi:hypothetical protein
MLTQGKYEIKKKILVVLFNLKITLRKKERIMNVVLFFSKKKIEV